MRFALAVAATAALSVGAVGAAARPDGEQRAALTALEATNRLMAMPWAAFGKQMELDAEKGLEGYEGKTIAGGGGNIGITYKGVGVTASWKFGVKTHNVQANVDLSAPPGIINASPSELSFAAPRSGGWTFGYQAMLEPYAWVKVAGNKIYDQRTVIPFAIFIKDFRIPARAILNSSEPDRPKLVGATIVPSMRLTGAGALPGVIPVTFQTTVEQGKITMRANAFSMPLAEFGFANARINAGMRIVLQPLSKNESDEDPVVKFGKNRMRMTVTLTGTLSAEIRYVPSAKESFSVDLLTFDANVPTLEELNDLLHLTKQETPRSWGEGNPRGWVPEPPTNANYASTAAALEAGIDDHLPYGAILSIDCRVVRSFVPNERRQCEDYTWAGEEDSAIWTGHYLAAEAFRYAAGDTAALPRVEKALAGIERLFWVTGDAAIAEDERVVVGYERGLLARTAAPSQRRNASGSYATPLSERKCYYVRPEGGWTANGRRFSTLRAMPSDLRDGARPVGTIWHGWGCSNDHAVTKDQYTGVLYGLALAHRLVPVTSVQTRARELIREALDYLWSTGWNIRVPPKNRVEESFLGDFAKQTGFLRVGASIVGQPYVDRYNELAPANEHAWIPLWFKATEPVVQYYGFNLSHAALTSALLFEDDPARRAGFLHAHSIMWRAVRHHHNAYFGLLRVLVQPPAQRAAFAQTTTPWLNPQMTVAKEVRSVLHDWIVRYEAVRSSSGMPRSAVGDPTVQAGMASTELGRYVAFDGSTRRLSVFALPLRGRTGRDKDFMWQRDPFDTAYRGSVAACQSVPPPAEEVARCGSRPNRVHPGVDYLIAYWLARYLGIVS